MGKVGKLCIYTHINTYMVLYTPNVRLYASQNNDILENPEEISPCSLARQGCDRRVSEFSGIAAVSWWKRERK